MVYSYPAILKPRENGGYSVRVPDLPGCISSGRDLSDSLDMITDAMSLWLCAAEDNKDPAIEPTDPRKIEHGQDDIIRADTTLYRAMTDARAVKKTVSIPQWMAFSAERMGLSLSQILQDALRKRIGAKA